MPKKNDGPPRAVWGLRIAREIRLKWRLLSVLIGVPVGRLIEYVLEDWLTQNKQVSDPQSIDKLRKAILDMSQNFAEAEPMPMSDDDFRSLRTFLSIRNVNINTRVKLKTMAAARGVPMNIFLDSVIGTEWEKMIENESLPRNARHTLEKELKKLLYDQMR